MKLLTDIPEWMALKRAVSILGLGGPFDVHNRAQKALANAEEALSTQLRSSYTIGPGNTYHQAWTACLADSFKQEIEALLAESEPQSLPSLNDVLPLLRQVIWCQLQQINAK